MGETLIINGKKHYVPYKTPKTKAAFDTFVCTKAKERLNASGHKKLSLCINILKDYNTPFTLQKAYEAAAQIVEDSIYYSLM